MPVPTRRRDLRSRRHRRQEEDGEEEGSIVGDVEDFSTSEGSAISNGDEDDADVEGSEISGEDDASVADTANKIPEPQIIDGAPTNVKRASGPPQFGQFKTTADTVAMLNGLKTSTTPQDEPQSDLIIQDEAQRPSAESVHTPQDYGETFYQRSRREHQEYIKQRDSNPAFVPTRGGFFLHDDRSHNQHAPHGRPYQRGRGRAYGPGFGPSRGYGLGAEPLERPWAHDLHDTVNKAMSTPPSRVTPALSQVRTAKPAAQPPNRTFSVTSVLGNVTVQMSLPEIEDKKIFTSVVKKQYTLLPQHRPPLRRDKPVRISIPDEQPRYIFPSIERSFIFIPRALRPNQQSFSRGRVRGSFHGSRRPSMFGGSIYTPSIGMSRKSSISGVPSNGLHTPTEPIMRGGMFPMNVPRPVVRLPMAPMPLSIAPMQYIPTSTGPHTPTMPEYGAPGPAFLQSPPNMIPMHQPRPQKTLSVAGIESPESNAPQQQEEQPFHQQMPTKATAQENHLQPPTAGATANTPLSHIPEGAVYAQPFQPYSYYQQSGYYGVPYSTPPMFAPQTIDGSGYMPMGGPVVNPQLIPNAQPNVAQNSGQGAVMQDGNGMMYYYDQSQYGVDGSMPQYQAGGMIPPAPFYYQPMPPQGMFYPPPSG